MTRIGRSREFCFHFLFSLFDAGVGSGEDRGRLLMKWLLTLKKCRIVFNGTWSGYLPLNCSYEFTGLQRGGWPSGYVGGIYCRLAERKKEIVVTPSVTHSISDAPIPSHYIGLG